MIYWWTSAIFSVVIIVGMGISTTMQAVNFKRKDPAKELIGQLYKDVDGYNLKEEERDYVLHKGGEPTYGEITYESAQKLLRDLKLTYKDIFYDLGSGVGKMVVQAYVTTPVKKAVGVELANTRAGKALQVKDALSKMGKLDKNRQLEFYPKSMTEVSLDDATVIYLCSTCFSQDLMKQITDKCLKLKPGLRIITLKKLADHP